MRCILLTTALVVCTLAPTRLAFSDQAILIGGGYNINASQGQIELNVKWVQDVLRQADLPVTTFFTDGDDPAPDVHYLYTENENVEPQPIDQLAIQLEPVARLFGDQQLNQQRYRNHAVDNVQGSTKAESLTESLENLLSSAPDDPSLIIYNGHGKQSSTTADKVTLELWDDTNITANELHSILDKSNAPSRFVFTQCYSGGFHRLAYANPEKGLELSSNTRCGFTSESAYRIAEGCSASINSDDYRDYTTYFFAALNGYDRHGEILPVNTDQNKDGSVSLREAHLYTLESAHSTDLSRSTSEDYLNSWQPWYLKWASAKQGLPNNEYAKLYRTLADKFDIPLTNNTAKDIRSKLNSYVETTEKLNMRRQELQGEIESVQQQLIQTATKRWPAFREQPGYNNLVNMQNEDESIDVSLLDAERNVTQMQKLFHFRKLANLKEQLYIHGDQTHINDYEKLVSCEDTPLVINSKDDDIPRTATSDAIEN